MAKTSEYYKKNPKAAAKRRKQQKRYNKTSKGPENQTPSAGCSIKWKQ